MHETPSITFAAATAADAAALATLRVEAMRESLERIGRFDPVRARERFLSGFSFEHTWHVMVDGERAGFYVVKPHAQGLTLDHLYVHPLHQRQGVGAAVLARVFSQADALGCRVRVGALRDSESNRFYARHGFVLVEQGEFDNYYVRPIKEEGRAEQTGVVARESRVLRDARLQDAAALCEAERAVVRLQEGLLVSGPEELLESAFRDRISAHLRGAAKVLVAEVAGQAVGHASLWPMWPRKLAHVFRLDMCVHAGHWRQGHGRSLLEALLRWAAAHPDVHKVELLVRSENRSAVALYAKLGFTVEGRLKDRVRLQSGRFIDDLCMALIVHRPELDERTGQQVRIRGTAQ